MIHPFNTDTAKGIAVVLPEGFGRPKVFNDPGKPYLSVMSGANTYRIYLPDREYDLLGFVSGLSQWDAASILEIKEVETSHEGELIERYFYFDHMNKLWEYEYTEALDRFCEHIGIKESDIPNTVILIEK